MPKTKKRTRFSLFNSNGVTAVAIVMLSVSLGALLLPRIFADTAVPVVTNVSAAASNNDTFSVTLTWDGHTPDHWKGETIVGTSQDNWQSNSKTKTFNNLICGAQYTFRVAAAGDLNGTKSAFKSDTATTRCPSVAWSNLVANGNNVVATWQNTSGMTQKYTVYVRQGTGQFVGTGNLTGTSRTVAGICNTAYSVYISAFAGSPTQAGNITPVRTVPTAPCPVTPGTPQSPDGGGNSPGGGGTGGGTGTGTGTGGSGTGTKKPATKSVTSSNPVTQVADTTPGVPENLSADIISSKIVQLTWDDATNADHYVIQRSTDNLTWQDLTTSQPTSVYRDETAAFDTTYYYQVQTVNAAGQKSEFVGTQATTEGFTSSSNVVTSPDKLVTVSIPDGAIDGEYNCTLSTDSENSANAPAGQSLVLGPYDMLCVTNVGDVITDFSKPAKVSMKLASVADGYKDITIRSIGDKGWTTEKSTYDQQKQVIGFSLSSAKTFGAYGVKKKSAAGAIFSIFLLLLLVAGLIFGFLFWRRRRSPDHVAAVQSTMSAEDEFKQALAQPDCSHLGMAQQVTPSGQGCYECEQQGTSWSALRICLICGHVGCSDDSPQQHALKHFQETGHPIMYDYADPNGNSIGWCYVDQTYI